MLSSWEFQRILFWTRGLDQGLKWCSEACPSLPESECCFTFLRRLRCLRAALGLECFPRLWSQRKEGISFQIITANDLWNNLSDWFICPSLIRHCGQKVDVPPIVQAWPAGRLWRQGWEWVRKISRNGCLDKITCPVHLLIRGLFFFFNLLFSFIIKNSLEGHIPPEKQRFLTISNWFYSLSQMRDLPRETFRNSERRKIQTLILRDGHWGGSSSHRLFQIKDLKSSSPF